MRELGLALQSHDKKCMVYVHTHVAYFCVEVSGEMVVTEEMVEGLRVTDGK